MLDTDILDHVKRPGSYLGCEVGARAKTPPEDGVHWVLAFPDAYEIGATHMGFQIIYSVLNDHYYSSADRVFAPWDDYESELKRRGKLLCSLEKDRPLCDFDVVGFSLAYELSYTNVLRILDLGGIPVRAAERNRSDPLVVVGGVCAANPEPMVPFIDAFVLGDGEEVAVEISDTVRNWKSSGASRDKLLDDLADVEGVYVPSRWKSGKVITAGRIADLDAAPFPTCMVVPMVEAVHDRAAVEIARGCPHACRYCQAGYTYRPLRERSPGKVAELAQKIVRNSGYSDLTLLSLSAGDYPAIADVIRMITQKLDDRHTAINLPSLRAGTIAPEVIELIKTIRKTGFTIAPEAGSERLRCVINKGISDDEIVETARTVYWSGWKLIKLYFMFGLPTETDEDTEDIVKLVRRVRKAGLDAGIKPNINVSLGAFVPKPHTPFQWEPMLQIEHIRDKLDFLKKRLRIPGVKVTWSDPCVSFIEGVMARGDRGVSEAIERAWRLGASFDGWGDHLKFEVWDQAFRETGIDARSMASNRRAVEGTLPWDHMHIGASKKYLLKEKERALDGVCSPGCGADECEEHCGACTSKVELKRTRPETLHSHEDDIKPAARNEFHRYRLFYRKVGPSRYLGHLDTIRAVHQSLRRAGLPLRYSEGYHPKPRTRFGAPLPLGIASLFECFDVDFTEPARPADIIRKLNEAMPCGMNASGVFEIDLDETAPQESVKSVRYRYEVPEGGVSDPYARMDKARSFRDSETFPLELKNKGKKRIIDLKDFVVDIKIFVGAAVEIEMVCNERGITPRPDKVWEIIFGDMPPYARIIKIETVMESGGEKKPKPAAAPTLTEKSSLQ